MATKSAPKATSPFAFYLASYCVLQILLHAYLLTLTGRSLLEGSYQWSRMSAIAIGATLLQLVDVAHCLVGLTKGNVAASLIQIFGRYAMLRILDSTPVVQDGTAAALLVIVYAAVEPCRYPYYALNALGVEVYPVTWLRYSAFLLLYPLGLSMEGVNMFLAIPYHYEHSTWSLGGTLNLNGGVILGVFLVAVFPFIARFLLGHMLKQRRTKLALTPEKKNKLK